MKGKIISNRDVFERFNKLDSYHASTIVLAVKTDVTLTRATLRNVSAKANQFFGKRAEADDLVNKSGKELMEMLRDWMDPIDYDAFIKDQERVFKEYGEDKEAHARVPAVFSDRHPTPNLKSGAFAGEREPRECKKKGFQRIPMLLSS